MDSSNVTVGWRKRSMATKRFEVMASDDKVTMGRRAVRQAQPPGRQTRSRPRYYESAPQTHPAASNCSSCISRRMAPTSRLVLMYYTVGQDSCTPGGGLGCRASSPAPTIGVPSSTPVASPPSVATTSSKAATSVTITASVVVGGGSSASPTSGSDSGGASSGGTSSGGSSSSGGLSGASQNGSFPSTFTFGSSGCSLHNFSLVYGPLHLSS